MSSTGLKTELHRIIDKIDDDRILQAVHTLLEGQDGTLVSTDSKAMTKNEMDFMLSEGEEDISAGKVTNHKELLEEIKTWRKK